MDLKKSQLHLGFVFLCGTQHKKKKKNHCVHAPYKHIDLMIGKKVDIISWAIFCSLLCLQIMDFFLFDSKEYFFQKMRLNFLSTFLNLLIKLLTTEIPFLGLQVLKNKLLFNPFVFLSNGLVFYYNLISLNILLF